MNTLKEYHNVHVDVFCYYYQAGILMQLFWNVVHLQSNVRTLSVNELGWLQRQLSGGVAIHILS